jgi:hypothetical protein
MGHISRLAAFPGLHELAITATQWVNENYYNERWWENQEYGVGYGDPWIHEYDEDHNRVAVVFFRACPKLQVLRVLKENRDGREYFDCQTFEIFRQNGVKRVRKVDTCSEWNGISDIVRYE